MAIPHSDGSCYNENYYRSSCGVSDYVHNPAIRAFFQRIARDIRQRFAPRTVLDAGCACGHLVRALREIGIEAYGIDISEYAVGMAAPEIRDYCRAGSLTEPLPPGLPERYDLAVNIEVLEHIPEAGALTALERLTGYSDRILFSSSPDDVAEATHVNVHEPEYWIGAFAAAGFRVREDCRFACVAPQCLIFERSTGPVEAKAECSRLLWRLARDCFELDGRCRMFSESIFGRMERRYHAIRRIIGR